MDCMRFYLYLILVYLQFCRAELSSRNQGKFGKNGNIPSVVGFYGDKLGIIENTFTGNLETV